MAIHFDLKKIMDERGLTPADIMNMTDLSRNTVKALVGGINTRIDFPTLDVLCEKLGVNPGDLIKYVPNEKDASPQE
ncbi:helix-turn-helix domain-containing protein [Paenibacillus naphthalenovorans]|uniref:helix-turn-helix domain-containing protein n=1 Tax=Paenibacillus naphthalenovorans TaxID=162209 RepID=UPI003D28C7BF